MLTDDVIKQFAESKNRGGSDAASEEPEGSAGEGLVEASDGTGGFDDSSTGGDQAVGEPGAIATPDEPGAVEQRVEPSVERVDDGAVPQDPVAAAAYWQKQAESEAKRRKDTQSQKDREVAEANAKVEALQSLWESDDSEFETPSMQMPAEDQLDAWVAVAPADAFQSVLQSGTPQDMQGLIASVYRVHGEAYGQQAQQSYQAALVAQQQAVLQHQIESVRESVEAPARQQAEFRSALAEVRDEYGAEALQSVAPRVQALIRENYEQGKSRYATTAAFIEAQFLRAFHEQSLSAAAQAPIAAAPPVQHVEHGGGAAVAEPEKSYAQIKAERLKNVHENGITYA